MISSVSKLLNDFFHYVFQLNQQIIQHKMLTHEKVPTGGTTPSPESKRKGNEVTKLYIKEVVQLKLLKILDFIEKNKLEGSTVRIYSNYFLNKFISKYLPGAFKRKSIHAEILIPCKATMLLHKIITVFQKGDSYSEQIEVTWEDYKPNAFIKTLINEDNPRPSEIPEQSQLIVVNIMITWHGPCPRTLVPSKELEDSSDGPFEYYIIPGNLSSPELREFGTEACSQIKQVNTKTKCALIFMHPYEKQMATEIEEEIIPMLLQQKIQKKDIDDLNREEFGKVKRILLKEFSPIFNRWLFGVESETQFTTERDACGRGKVSKLEEVSPMETNIIFELVKIRTIQYGIKEHLIERRKLACFNFLKSRICEFEKQIKDLLRIIPTNLMRHYELGAFIDEILPKTKRADCNACKIF